MNDKLRIIRNEATAEVEEQSRYGDMANADRLVAHAGDKLRYVKQWGWMVYDGKRWQRDETRQVMEHAKATVRAMRQEAAEMEDPMEGLHLFQWANTTAKYKQRMEAMVDLAASDPRIAATVDQFDTDPWLFNCANGTIDLRTGELRPHDPKDMLTWCSPVAYDPDAKSKDWDGFLSDIMCGDQEMMAYLKRAVGYSLTGSTREKGLFYLYGPQGDNGKTTFLEAVKYVMGGYGHTMRPQTILQGRGGNIPNDVAELAGRRFVETAEPPAGEKLNVSLVKQLTGSDTIEARFLNAEFFQFRPVLKMWLAANDRLEVPDAGNAMWGRMFVVPFNASFPKGHPKRDEGMPEKLREAAPAILAWAVRGCLEWHTQGGLRPPRAVTEATEEYRNDNDPLTRFLSETYTRDPNGRVAATALCGAYNRWWPDNDGEHLSNAAIYKKLAGLGHPKKKSNGAQWVMGLSEPESAPVQLAGDMTDF